MHTCIYNSGMNNIQSNFIGSKEDAIKSFKEEMVRVNANWGHLFNVSNGDLVSSYLKENQNNQDVKEEKEEEQEEHLKIVSYRTKKIGLVSNLTIFDYAISNSKEIMLKNKDYNIWEDFDYESYVLRDILKMIESKKIGFVI